jgi:voltage-gated potassium channel
MNTARVQATLEWSLAFLALLVIPVLVVEDRAASAEVRSAARTLNWVIWLAFAADFLIRWATDRRWRFLRESWFDLILILLTPPVLPESLQGIRALRVLRLVRVGAMVGIGLRSARRAFGPRKFHLVAMFAAATVLLGAAGVFLFEGGENRSIQSFEDAIWWAIVTATTVGYGDVSPITTEGRVIAVMLMLIGIGVIGVFTATVASHFFAQDEENVIAARLDAVERKLDLLLERSDSGIREP